MMLHVGGQNSLDHAGPEAPPGPWRHEFVDLVVQHCFESHPAMKILQNALVAV